MAEGVEAVPEKVGDGLGKKLGPLPVWAWLVGGVVLAAGAYYLLVGRKGGGSAANPFGNFPNMPGVLGGSDTGSTGTTSTTTTATPATAAQIQSALTQAAASLGITVAEAQLYWNEYLGGTSPVGSTQASGLYNSLVNSVNTILGSGAPAAPSIQNVNSNPFTTNASWLNEILAFLPSGTSSADINAIIGWVNGTTTTLSQSAVNALLAAQGIVGNAPNPLSYTIAPSATTGNTVSTTAAQQYLSYFGSLGGASPSTIYNDFLAQSQSLLGVSGLTSNQLSNLWNAIQQQLASNSAVFSTAAGTASWLNSQLGALSNNAPTTIYTYVGGPTLGTINLTPTANLKSGKVGVTQ